MAGRCGEFSSFIRIVIVNVDKNPLLDTPLQPSKLFEEKRAALYTCPLKAFSPHSLGQVDHRVRLMMSVVPSSIMNSSMMSPKA